MTKTAEDQGNMGRARSPELDALIGYTWPVGDKGFVQLVDYFGNDEAIVQAARVSYGAGTKSVSDDRALIRYLMRHRHTTPFEMCELKLHVKVAMDTWRQWIRHRTANVNEYSTRYSVAIDDTVTTKPGEWRRQSKANKQGSSGFLDPEIGFELTEAERRFHEEARHVYNVRLENDVAREQARKDLPLSTYTEAYWKCDLHNLLHFLSLRMDSHAQKEIREYADVIGNKIVAAWVPETWDAFLDYRLNALTLSASELGVIRLLVSRNLQAEEAINSLGKREREELFAKLPQLGISMIPFGTQKEDRP